ncbi:hypothetical protein [Capnocytophaga stomatis]|uniref:hypothetical protein n=1 Tax=Capnocytophaga stomatis TaxID=1848904 RepID=UPI001ACB05CC|nr:hypothetical protein [Capnocytophaga stomatis]GIM48810.1 hypothetical protein CAPN003_02620 [Capnocytophaga stomatis]
MESLNGAKIHQFAKIETSDKYKEVTHYERIHQTATSRYIQDFANISVQRNFNRSENVAFWYKPASRKQDGKRDTWAKHPLTGLFRTAHPQIYYGDISSKDHYGRYKKHTLLFFVFNIDRTKLAIIEYPNFYPYDLELCVNVQVLQIKKYFGI